MLAAGSHPIGADLHAIGYPCMLCTTATRRAAAPGSRYRAGHGIQLLKEDLAMSGRMPEPGSAGDQRGSEPGTSDTAEFAKIRTVMRASEKHRKGGADPELQDANADPGPDT